MDFDLGSHVRRNALTGEWVLVSPHRLQRPWQGQIEAISEDDTTDYQADCYLCPGNSRANGQTNPPYKGHFIFPNDFPALSASPVEIPADSSGLLQARAAPGQCLVFCYSEQHSARLATMNPGEIQRFIAALAAEFKRLDQQQAIDYIQIFENRGEMMGCSNAHPHAQIWALQGVPTEIERELEQQRLYYRQHHQPLLLDYVALELEHKDRIIYHNDEFAVLVPWWAVWPYEMLILPRTLCSSVCDLTISQQLSLSRAVQQALTAYEKLFKCAAPYSLGFHNRPSDGREYTCWQFHMHIYPPLLRSASIRKHQVGFEMLAMRQRDLTPEQAAGNLRRVLSPSTE